MIESLDKIEQLRKDHVYNRLHDLADKDIEGEFVQKLKDLADKIKASASLEYRNKMSYFIDNMLVSESVEPMRKELANLLKEPRTKSGKRNAPDNEDTLPTIISPVKKKVCGKNNIYIGSNSFEELIQKSTIFVDKTLFIKDFVESNYQVILITYPRRWGKSTNINMIKTFLEIELHKESQKRYEDKKQAPNYNLFQGKIISEDKNGRLITKGKIEQALNIAKPTYKEFVENNQGEYPVILIDFKDVSGKNYKHLRRELWSKISENFLKYNYILNRLTSIIQDKDKTPKEIDDAEADLKAYNTYKDQNFIPAKGAQPIEKYIHNSFKTLSRILWHHFNKTNKVYILMDEYDAPINNILQNKDFPSKDVNKSFELISGLLSTTFKANEFLERGLITGIFNTTIESVFSGLNNVGMYNFFNNKFAKYYGFTHEEVNNLFNKYKIEDNLREQAKDWYDGYRIKDKIDNNKDLEMYNTWSIVNFLSEQNIKSFWRESGSIDFIKHLFKVGSIKEKINALLLNQEIITVNLSELKFTQDKFNILKNMMHESDKFSISQEGEDLFFAYIFLAGYLTVSDCSNASTDQKSIKVKLPNREVKGEFASKLIDYYKVAIISIKWDLFTDVSDKLANLLNRDLMDFQDEWSITSQLEQSLSKLVQALPPFTKVNKDAKKAGVHGNEDIVHSILNVIGLQVSELTQFGSEVYCKNKQRLDIMMYKKSIGNKPANGMIIELKFDGSAEEALKQIQDKRYAEIFRDHNDLKHIKCLGINVSKDKKVDVKFTGVNSTDADVVLNRNSGGEGINIEGEIYNLTYHESFNKYYSNNFEKILKLRIKDFNIRDKIKILPARYQLSQDNTGVDEIIEELIALKLRDEEIVLIPYNIENKHWVGLIVTNNNNGLQINYIDPANAAIQENLLIAFGSKKQETECDITLSQITVEQQKFNNCGPEVIENMVLLTTGDRIINQEDVVLIHSHLLEQELLGASLYEIDLSM